MIPSFWLQIIADPFQFFINLCFPFISFEGMIHPSRTQCFSCKCLPFAKDGRSVLASTFGLKCHGFSLFKFSTSSDHYLRVPYSSHCLELQTRLKHLISSEGQSQTVPGTWKISPPPTGPELHPQTIIWATWPVSNGLYSCQLFMYRSAYPG